MTIPAVLPGLPARKPDTHKGDYGKVMVIAGSLGMTGAAVLCCDGAYRSGAGLVYLIAPASLYSILSPQMPCTVIQPVDDNKLGSVTSRSFDQIRDFSDYCDVAAIGPGLSRNKETQRLVQWIIPRFTIPMVLDADALNAVAERTEVLTNPHTTLVLTPHVVELSRLLQAAANDIKKDRVKYAMETAQKFKSIVVLKGHRTIVTDGSGVYENPTGNPGMATGGSGDILTGMIAALIGQKFSAIDAAKLGVYLHGLAGDIAAEKLGQISMMATDILAALPEAFEKYRTASAPSGSNVTAVTSAAETHHEDSPDKEDAP